MKQRAAVFDAGSLTSELRFAPSLDGTKVPYFLVRNPKAPATAPCLLDGSRRGYRSAGCHWTGQVQQSLGSEKWPRVAAASKS